MKVLSYDPYNPEATHNDNLNEMLAACDVVSMHAVVTPETEGIMGAAQFAAMKEGAVYINSAATAHDLQRELRTAGEAPDIAVVCAVYDLATVTVKGEPQQSNPQLQ